MSAVSLDTQEGTVYMKSYLNASNDTQIIVTTNYDTMVTEYLGVSNATGEIINESTINIGFILDNLEYQFLSACVKQGLPHPAIDRTTGLAPVFDENEDAIWEDYDPEGCKPEYDYSDQPWLFEETEMVPNEDGSEWYECPKVYESPFPDYYGEEFRACSELWTYPTPAEMTTTCHICQTPISNPKGIIEPVCRECEWECEWEWSN